MAREIVTNIWCDPCFQGPDQERNEGEEVTIALNGTAPKVMALCDRHRKELYIPLAAALTEYGQRTEGSARGGKTRPAGATSGRPTAAAPATAGPLAGKGHGGEHKCPECDYAGPTRDALNSHLTNYHDTSLAEVEAAAAGETLPYACDVEDCARTFPAPQGKGAHMRAKHGILGANSKQQELIPA